MKIKAILVDDSPLEQEMIKEGLDWEKLNICICGTASNGTRGIELYKNVLPDLILVDIQMPGMDGVEMVRQIRNINDTVTVVFLSNYRNFEYARSGYGLGVKEYILKQDIDTKETELFFENLVKEMEEKKGAREEEKRNAYSPPVQMASEYMKNHYYEKQLRVEEIAEKVYLSPSRFRTVFKQETGISPSQYLSDVRLAEAEKLLEKTCMKLDDIADATGYLSGAYFHKIFVHKYGITPKEFLRRAIK